MLYFARVLARVLNYSMVGYSLHLGPLCPSHVDLPADRKRGSFDRTALTWSAYRLFQGLALQIRA